MSVVSVREVKNKIKKHKNIMDSQNKGSSMSYGGGFESIPKAFRVGPCMKKLAKRAGLEAIAQREAEEKARKLASKYERFKVAYSQPNNSLSDADNQGYIKSVEAGIIPPLKDFPDSWPALFEFVRIQNIEAVTNDPDNMIFKLDPVYPLVAGYCYVLPSVDPIKFYVVIANQAIKAGNFHGTIYTCPYLWMS